MNIRDTVAFMAQVEMVRNRLGCTGVVMSRMLGISHPLYSQFLHGRKTMAAKRKKQIEHYLDYCKKTIQGASVVDSTDAAVLEMLWLMTSGNSFSSHEVFPGGCYFEKASPVVAKRLVSELKARNLDKSVSEFGVWLRKKKEEGVAGFDIERVGTRKWSVIMRHDAKTPTLVKGVADPAGSGWPGGRKHVLVGREQVGTAVSSGPRLKGMVAGMVGESLPVGILYTSGNEVFEGTLLRVSQRGKCLEVRNGRGEKKWLLASKTVILDTL